MNQLVFSGYPDLRSSDSAWVICLVVVLATDLFFRYYIFEARPTPKAGVFAQYDPVLPTQPVQAEAEVIVDWKLPLPPVLIGDIVTLYLESILTSSLETIRFYRTQGKTKLPREAVSLMLSSQELRDVTVERWRTIWATCGRQSCPSHRGYEDMRLAPDNRIITAGKGCLETGIDLSLYFQLLFASLNYHNDWEWDGESQSCRMFRAVVAFPVSLTRLEIVHMHANEEDVIALVLECCPCLVELRLVRCTMFSNPACEWWNANDHDYFKNPVEEAVRQYANNVVSRLRGLHGLRALHLGHYLMDRQAITTHRIHHAEHYLSYDSMNPFDQIGARNTLEAAALQLVNGGPPIDMSVPSLARREFWETPCFKCKEELLVPTEDAERLAACIFGQLESLHTVSFSNFLSQGCNQPCTWYLERAIGLTTSLESTPQWTTVDQVQSALYADRTHLRVAAKGGRSNRQTLPFTFTMRGGTWDL